MEKEMEKLSANDPETRSVDILAQNIDRLKDLFPEVVTEGKIDFEVLKQLLGGVAEEREEKYGLNWHGKRRARQLALTPSTGTLRPCPEESESVDWDTTQNLMIEGDNLEVLKLLQRSYAGKVKLIYIDPPYNTGKDFIYLDDYQDSIKNYLMLTGQIDSDGRRLSSNTEASGRFHTDWLNMMYPRLKLARNLLKEDGIIFISIDDNEYASLRKLCDDVFGEENLVGTVIWKGATDNNPTQIAVEHEYLLCYCRHKDSAEGIWKNATDASKQVLLQEFDRLKTLGLSESDIQTEIRSFIRTHRDALAAITHYDRVDTIGIYTGSRKVHNPKPGGYEYDVVHPVTGKVCVPPVNGYRYPETTMKELIDSGRILYGDDETQIIQIKEYLKDYSGKLSSVILLDSRTGSNELNKMFGVQKIFSNPKPVALLKTIFDFVAKPGDLVLDFFAGSASTGQAIVELNTAGNLNRRYILVQLPEPLDPTNKDQKVAANFCDKIGKPRNIAELTKERLRRAGKKIRDENPLFTADLGFRVFKLDSTNIRAWEPNPDNLAQTLLDNVEHIKSGRTETDILYELLLKLGLDLCVPIKGKTIAGKTVHSIGAGTLMVCLASQIAREEVEELALGMAEWHKELVPAGESTVVFRDGAFADDVAKTNLTAILQQHGLENVRSL